MTHSFAWERPPTYWPDISLDYEPQGEPCSTCGETVAHNDDVDCRRHTCCVDCSWEARAYGRSTGNYCLSCLREAVKRERNVWAMPWNGAWQASWHSGACPFALCHRTEAHQHMIFVDRDVQI